MEPPTRDHIKYQFCNVYSDLLSDLKNAAGAKPSSVKINDDNEISFAPIADKKPATAAPVPRTRGRSRKSLPEDIFSELKATRSKRKQAFDHNSDITANFDSSFDSTSNERQMQVVAEIHRDASQPAESFTKKEELTTSDEIFNSLLDKKSNEIEINFSQDSEDFFRVSKKPRKSYPGASHSKESVSNDGCRQSKRFENHVLECVEGPELDLNADSKQVMKKLDKKTVASTTKSFSPISKSTKIAIDNSESDKQKSSPGWSRVKAVAKDFKDTNYKKPLNISINKTKQSFSKTSSTSIKAENSAVLNISTSDSDQSDVRYFDSPEAAKRCQLMKHIVETVEKNELISTDHFSSTMDPSMKLMVKNLKKNREEYVKKLTDPVNQNEVENSDGKSIENITGGKNPKTGEESGKVSSEPIIGNDGNQRSKSSSKVICSLDSLKSKDQDIPIVSDVSISDDNIIPSLSDPVSCVKKLDNDKPDKGFKSTTELGAHGKPVEISSKISSSLECSDCDVLETPLSSSQKSGLGGHTRKKSNVLSNSLPPETLLSSKKKLRTVSLTRKKSNAASKELDNVLTQVLDPPTAESLTHEADTCVSTIASSENKNLCFRCKCSISDLESNQNYSAGIKTEFSCSEEKKRVKMESKRPKIDVCIQTDDVCISDVRHTKDFSVQTSLTPQTLETLPVRTEEDIIRMKDEYILQTLKTLMIQASHKLTVNDLYNLGLEQENEPPRKKLKEITVNYYQSFPRFEDDVVRNETLPHQPWPLSANRGTTSDIPPSNLKTPQNQFIKRKLSSDAKYTSVSTPSSSERKLLDDTKFLNRSTVCLKDVTICENEEVHSTEDSIMKDVVPMEVEGDSSNPTKSVESKVEMIDKVGSLGEVGNSKVDVVKIKDRMNSSCSNDSVILSSRKSARSLNFQSFFTKSSNNASDNPSSTGKFHESSQLDFSNEANSHNHSSDDGLKKLFISDSRMGNSNPGPTVQVDDMEYSEDIRKSLSIFRECMNTQKVDGDHEVGIVENSDDESIIQATPKKNKPLLTEASLTPDMLSSQNSQLKTGEDTNQQQTQKVVNSPNKGESCEENIEPKLCLADSDSCATKHLNSNIDSQVNEIPSSLVPTSEDFFSKRIEGKNHCYNTFGFNQNGNQTDHTNPTLRNRTNNVPVPPVTNHIEGHGSNHVTSFSGSRKRNEPQRFYITTSGLPKNFISGVQEFCKQFDCVYESEITERTTHLVIRTNNNKALSTMKFILAVAMHKLIVTIDWMSACSKAKKILQEDPYIPLSSSGRPGPLNSLLDRSNATSSPLFKAFIIHVIPPFSNFKKEDFTAMLTHCGAGIAENYADLAADKSRIRLLLVNNESVEEESNFYRGVVYRYKAFVLTHDWAIESVSNYKIEPFCIHNPLNAVYSFEMVEHFQIPDYIRDLASRYFESNEDCYEDTVSEISHLHQ